MKNNATHSAAWRCWLTGCMAVVMLAANDLQRQTRKLRTHVSRYSVEETLLRLEAHARLEGLDVFARLGSSGKHATGRRAGAMLVLGPSASETPVIQAAPDAPIHLPLTLWVEPDPRSDGAVVHLPVVMQTDQAETSLDLLRSVALLPMLVDAALA